MCDIMTFSLQKNDYALVALAVALTVALAVALAICEGKV
jgi:hypothetical protein